MVDEKGHFTSMRVSFAFLGVNECYRDVSPVDIGSVPEPSQDRTQSEADREPFDGTREDKPSVEGPDHRGGRRDSPVLNPPCCEHAGIVADSCEA